MRHGWRHTILVIIIIVVLFCELGASVFAIETFNQQLGTLRVFFDDFESYRRTRTCNSVREHCEVPPQTGSPDDLPNYWIEASSGTCVTRGGCTTWGENKFMGPNSVVAVVAEEAASGTRSVKLGASDWFGDKTSIAVHLSPAIFPSGVLVTFTFSIWLSDGIDNRPCYCNPYHSGPDNALVIQAPVGKIRYYGDVVWKGQPSPGLWEIENTTSGGMYAFLGNYYMATKTWHTISVIFDWTNKVWFALVIDGIQPFSAVKGYPVYEPFVSSAGYVDFAAFIDPFADYQSITSARSHGYQPFYAYVDDVSILA